MSEPPKRVADDVAGSLVDALAAEGEHIDDGGFTLDPLAARRKLREHMLADPRAYVLLLVEAACLCGLDAQIRFALGTTTTATFEGPCLSDAQLGNPVAAVFHAGHDLRDRVTQLLGLAANAALSAGAERVTIHNADEQGRMRCVSMTPGPLDESGAEPVLEQLGRGPVGRTVFRFEGGALDFGRPKRERELLQSCCRFSSVAVSIDGERIDGGPGAVFADYRRVETTSIGVDELGIVGMAGHLGTLEPARALILTRGVLSETIELPRCRPGFVAIVDVDLRKDLSQARILRDAEFEAVLASIERAYERLPGADRALPIARDPTPKWKVAVVTALIVLPVPLLIVLATLRAEPDPHRALRRACDQGSEQSCVDLARSLPDVEALDILSSSCERGSEAACEAAALRESEATIRRSVDGR